jgi:hypothetical protein
MISLSLAWAVSSIMKYGKFNKIDVPVGIFIITGILDVAMVFVIMHGLELISK